MGRFGSILGPVIGGHLIAFGLPLGALFATAAAPVLVSASALFFLGRLAIVRDRQPGGTAELAISDAGTPTALPGGLTRT
jgi:hypothetical protein